jgi:surfeit locus 1 family protein
MIESLIENEQFRRIFPPVAAVGMIALFVSLGAWQLDRAAGKNRVQQLFEDGTPYSRLSAETLPADFQNIEANGRYDSDHQILIDKIRLDGRTGYYVITPLRRAAEDPWLIVNRGWVKKPAAGDPDPEIAVEETERTVQGRAGHLPRVGIHSGKPFASPGDWPKKAFYPTLEDLAAELDQGLSPVVLLLGPAEEDGFVRRWRPSESGPMMHYGYAFQWFAMAAVVLAVTVWRLRRRRLA